MEFLTKDIIGITLTARDLLCPANGEYFGTYGGSEAVFTDTNGNTWEVTTRNAVKGMGIKVLIQVRNNVVTRMLTL